MRGVAGGLPGAGRWTDGGADYSGAADLADGLPTGRAFGLQSGGTLSPSFLARRESQFGDARVSQLPASVPEPSLLPAWIIAALPFLSRRRRRK